MTPFHLGFLADLGKSPAPTAALILVVMALLALVEVAIPLHRPGRWNQDHLVPNLTLTLVTFVTNALFNVALVAALMALEVERFGILRELALGPLLGAVVAVAVLDFSFYVAHVAMHKVPWLWRFHSVHHSDPAVDVTTTVRQHPVEGVIRYVFMGAFAIALGVSPGAFAIYRVLSAVNGLFEHANIRVAPWLSDLLALVTTWPDMHKIHHSRVAHETDTNYGNILSLWDRIFLTFTPARRGVDISYGLAGLDEPEMQTTVGLLALPFHDQTPVRSALREP